MENVYLKVAGNVIAKRIEELKDFKKILEEFYAEGDDIEGIDHSKLAEHLDGAINSVNDAIVELGNLTKFIKEEQNG